MAALGEPHIGSVLLGGAGAIREKLCSPIEPRLRGWLEDIQNRVESALGEAEYIEALAEGKAMSFEEMIAFAMECNAGIEC
jgi:hypothetical protein